MRFAIRLIDKPTTRAGLRGISRVHENDRHAGQGSLVLDKLPKLVKRPRVKFSSLRLAKPCPVADAGQIFKSEAASGVFSLLNYFFTQAMVNVGSEPTLTTRQLFEASFGRARAFFLEASTLAAAAFSQAENLGTTMLFAVRVGGNVNDAKVNAKVTFHVIGGRIVGVTDGKQVKFAIDVTEVALAFLSSQKLDLAVASDKRDSLPTVNRPDRDLSPVELVAQYPVVVGDSAFRPECAFCVPVKLVGVGHFGDTANSHLGREVKPLSNRLVDNFLQFEFAKDLVLPSFVGNVVARGISQVHCGYQILALLIIRLQFDFSCKFHYSEL